ncbi:hypothetical protein D3C87_1452980 [compost metagenome]
MQTGADQVDHDQTAPPFQGQQPGGVGQALAVGRLAALAGIAARRRRVVDIDGDEGAGALDHQVQTAGGIDDAGGQRVLLGLEGGADRGRAGLVRGTGRQVGKDRGHIRPRRQQARLAGSVAKTAQDRSLAFARLSGDLDLDLGPLPRLFVLAQRQEAERLARAQIDESAAQGRLDPCDAADATRAQSITGPVAVALDDQVVIAPVASDDAASFARRLIEEDLDVGHVRRSWAASRRPEADWPLHTAAGP